MAIVMLGDGARLHAACDGPRRRGPFSGKRSVLSPVRLAWLAEGAGDARSAAGERGPEVDGAAAQG